MTVDKSNNMNEAKLDDFALVKRVCGGDTVAFDEIVLRHQDAVYNFLLRLTRNTHEAEDASQETFIRAYKGLRSYRGDAEFKTWLFRIGMNVFCSRHRKVSRINEVEGVSLDAENKNGTSTLAETVEAKNSAPEHALEISEEIEQVKSAIGHLEEKERSVLLLREQDQFSYAQIAEVEGISVSAVKSRLHRARNVLGKMLQCVAKGIEG